MKPLLAGLVFAVGVLGVVLAQDQTSAHGKCGVDHGESPAHPGHRDGDGDGLVCEGHSGPAAVISTTEQIAAYDRDEWAFDSGGARALLGCSPYEHVDHIVALKEAHDSGGAGWTDERKREFANDPLNLWCLDAVLNVDKAGYDLAEWDGGSCIQRRFIAERTAVIKTTYELTTDDAEATANEAALEADCTFMLDADRLALIRLLLRTLLDLLGP